MFVLHKQLAQINTNNTKYHQLQAAKEHDDNNNGGPTGNGIPKIVAVDRIRNIQR